MFLAPVLPAPTWFGFFQLVGSSFVPHAVATLFWRRGIRLGAHTSWFLYCCCLRRAVTSMLHSQWAHVAATFIVSVIVIRQLCVYECSSFWVGVCVCDSSVAQFVAALHKKLTIELTREFSVHDCLVACHIQTSLHAQTHTYTEVVAPCRTDAHVNATLPIFSYGF